MRLVSCVALVLLCVACGDDATDNPIENPDPPVTLLDIQDGPVQGTVFGDARAFLGIPYAQPPVGELRWKSPQPAAPWTETLDATSTGPNCPQNGLLTGNPLSSASEDCLTLNVWTPAVKPAQPLPVMVWLHGGGFSTGSGDGDGSYSGNNLVPTGDVVLVTVNYRLGALGFLAHTALTAEDPARATSGNYGLEDQRLALEWVQQNIAAFDGDPDNVTLFGESAGGMSTCSHLVSPGSEGLFHKAIIESGPCNMISRTMSEAEAQGDALAAALGCDDPTMVLDCLRSQPAEMFLDALPSDELLSGLTWMPVIDDDILTGAPDALIEQGAFHDMPVILGSNRDEGTLFLFLDDIDMIDETMYEALLTEAVGAFGVDPSAVLAQYPASAYADPTAALATVISEFTFNCPVRRNARAFAAAGVDTYLYHFARPVETPFGNFGAFHGAELAFVFGTNLFGLIQLTDEELPLSEAMMGYWTRFAHTGDPNGGEVAWPAFASPGEQHLELDLTIAAGSDLRTANCDFWDAL